MTSEKEPRRDGQETDPAARTGDPLRGADFFRIAKGLSRWMMIGPVVLLVLLTCGQVGIASARIPSSVDTRSRIKVDYSPWPFVVVRPVDPAIVEVIRLDMAAYTGTEMPDAGPMKGKFWGEPSATLSPTGITTLTSTPITPLVTSATETPTPITPLVTSATETSAPSSTPTVTQAASQTVTLTRTPTPSSSPVRTPTLTATAIAVGGSLVLRVGEASDDANEDGGPLEEGYSSVWLGNGYSRDDSWTGLRLADVGIPKGATIRSAILEAAPYEDTWIAVRFTIQAEAVGECAAFTVDRPPSQRMLTQESVLYDRNDPWLGNTYYALGDLAGAVQTVVDRPDWQSGNSMCIILHGEGTRWGRKYVYSFEGNPAMTPRLVVDYSFSASMGP